MKPTRNEDAAKPPRPIVDHPSRDPSDHPGRLPSESGPHPIAYLRLQPYRGRTRVLRSPEER